MDKQLHQLLWDEITYPFSNFNSAAIEVWEWKAISSQTLVGMWLLIHNSSLLVNGTLNKMDTIVQTVFSMPFLEHINWKCLYFDTNSTAVHLRVLIHNKSVPSHYLMQCSVHAHIFATLRFVYCFILNLSFDLNLHKSSLNSWLSLKSDLSQKRHPNPDFNVWECVCVVLKWFVLPHSMNIALTLTN